MPTLSTIKIKLKGMNEMQRQCELSWGRGLIAGLFWGILVGFSLGGMVIKFLLK